MHTDNAARQLADNALKQLAAALERGQSETLISYLAVMGQFHRYSWNNCLLIAQQRPEAKRVAGFHTWRKLGRHVKKGERGIAILAPVVSKKKTEAEDVEDDQTRLYGFRTAYVFDLEQTEGADLPKFARVEGNPQHYADRLKSLVAAKGITLDYSAEIAPALGRSHGGSITLLPTLSPADGFSTLVHELAHELLHHGERRKQINKTVRETEAEAVAFVVCHTIGLDTNSAASDYIQLYSGDVATLAESLAAIRSISAEILTAIGAGEEIQA